MAKELSTEGKPTKTVTIERRLTSDELNAIARQQQRTLQRMEELDNEKKAYNAQYTANYKNQQGILEQLMNEFSNETKWESRLCYVLHDYDRKEKLFIDVVTGKVIQTEVLAPSVISEYLNRQIDLADEDRKNEIAKELPEGVSFFWKKFSDELLKGQPDITANMLDSLEAERIAYISLCIDFLYSTEKIPAATSFDMAFDVASLWFNQFVDSVQVGPVSELIKTIPTPEPTTEAEAIGDQKSEADPLATEVLYTTENLDESKPADPVTDQPVSVPDQLESTDAPTQADSTTVSENGSRTESELENTYVSSDYKENLLLEQLAYDEAVSPEVVLHAIENVHSGVFKGIKALGFTIELTKRGKRALITRNGITKEVDATDAQAVRLAILEPFLSNPKPVEPTEKQWDEVEKEVKTKPVSDSVTDPKRVLDLEKKAAQARERRAKKKANKANESGDKPVSE